MLTITKEQLEHISAILPKKGRVVLTLNQARSEMHTEVAGCKIGAILPGACVRRLITGTISYDTIKDIVNFFDTGNITLTQGSLEYKFDLTQNNKVMADVIRLAPVKDDRVDYKEDDMFTNVHTLTYTDVPASFSQAIDTVKHCMMTDKYYKELSGVRFNETIEGYSAWTCNGHEALISRIQDSELAAVCGIMFVPYTLVPSLSNNKPKKLAKTNNTKVMLIDNDKFIMWEDAEYEDMSTLDNAYKNREQEVVFTTTAQTMVKELKSCIGKQKETKTEPIIICASSDTYNCINIIATTNNTKTEGTISGKGEIVPMRLAYTQLVRQLSKIKGDIEIRTVTSVSPVIINAGHLTYVHMPLRPLD